MKEKLDSRIYKSIKYDKYFILKLIYFNIGYEYVHGLLEKGDYYKNYLQLMNQLRPTNVYSYSRFEKIFNEIQKDKKHNIFVIEEDNVIVGTVTIVLETKFIYEGERLGHIEDLVVDKDYRKKGLVENL